MIALETRAGDRAAGKVRGRMWRCLSPGCGRALGEKVLVKGGYARLVIDFALVRRVEVCGHEVRVQCAKCGQARVWFTDAPTGQTA